MHALQRQQGRDRDTGIFLRCTVIWERGRGAGRGVVLPHLRHARRRFRGIISAAASSAIPGGCGADCGRSGLLGLARYRSFGDLGLFWRQVENVLLSF